MVHLQFSVHKHILKYIVIALLLFCSVAFSLFQKHKRMQKGHGNVSAPVVRGKAVVDGAVCFEECLLAKAKEKVIPRKISSVV